MLPIDTVIPTTKKEEIDLIQTLHSLGSYGNNCQCGEIIFDRVCSGNANVKRNFGAKLHNHEFLFFCDDDIWMKPGALMTMLETLLDNPTKGYTYCNFMAINHPCNGTFIHKAGPFDRDRLRSGNYISTMSLMRRDAFKAVGGFDESILRLQDWDLWLSMLSQGIEGVYIPETLFVANYSNTGITQATGYLEAEAIVKAKHNLC